MIRSLGLATVTAALLTGHAFAQSACKTTPIGSATAAAVRDGRTLTLADGRTLRLAGIDVFGASRAALQRLAAGKMLRLGKLGPDRDRYGRLVALAYAGDGKQSLQQALLAAGEARVAPPVGDMACARLLLAAEKPARAARRGIWADPRFLPIAAGNISRLRAETGQFALVEGKVLSVHPTGGTIYLNFGRRWTRDFSVIILRRRRHRFAAAGIDPVQLRGRVLRVRGVIEMRRGPVIEAEEPEQIELTNGVLSPGTDK
jgi:endonuclease YncB( thermonuclease family)